MIALSWNSDAFPTSIEADQHVAALMKKYRDLPRRIARKHLMAAMRRALRPGVPILKKHTPKQKSRLVLGRNAWSGEYTARKVKGGSLRRAVTVRTGQTGKNAAWDSFVWGVIGYRAGIESRKAIWLNYGTSNGVQARFMVERMLAEYRGPMASVLAKELADALEKASAELAGGKNPDQSFYKNR